MKLLTPLENAAAAERGWALSHVYDLKTRRWLVMVISLDPKINAREALHALVKRVQASFAPVELKALRLIMDSYKGKK